MEQEGIEFGRYWYGDYYYHSMEYMTCSKHLQTSLGTLEKMVKLLVIYGAIPPRVWAEMALQILCEPKKLLNRVWGMLL